MIFSSFFLHKIAGKLPQHHSTSFRGLPITIEWPKDSTRVGEDKNGKKWRREMKADYGYISQTTGAGDKEPLDVYIGPNTESDKVYVVEQLTDEGEFDEYKCLLGFDTLDEAFECYLSHYPEGWEDKNVGAVSEVPFEEVISGVKEHQEGQGKTAVKKQPRVPLTEAILYQIAEEVRDQLIPGRGAEDGDCDPVSSEIIERLEKMGYDAAPVYGDWNGHPHMWVTCEGWGIDATHDQFAAYADDDEIEELLNNPVVLTRVANTAPGTYPSRAVQPPRPTNFEHYVWTSCPFNREDHIMRGQKTDHTRFCDSRYYNPPISTKEYDNSTRGYAEVKNDSKVVILTISPVCRPDLLYYPPAVIEKFKKMYPGYKIYTGDGKIAGIAYLNALTAMSDS